MAKRKTSGAVRPGKGSPRRKLIAFEDETYGALDLLARDSMNSIQDLADEAFRDLLKKHGRTDDLRAALKQSAGRPKEDAATRAARGSARRR